MMEIQRDVHVRFIDYAKGFDKTKHKDLMGFLESIDLKGKDLCRILEPALI